MTKNILVINKKIKNFNKKINVSGDKSLSIRWVLFSSLSDGISVGRNLLLQKMLWLLLKRSDNWE